MRLPFVSEIVTLVLRKEKLRFSPVIVCSVYVRVALSLGEYGTIDGSTDAKGKLQFTVF